MANYFRVLQYYISNFFSSKSHDFHFFSCEVLWFWPHKPNFFDQIVFFPCKLQRPSHEKNENFEISKKNIAYIVVKYSKIIFHSRTVFLGRARALYTWFSAKILHCQYSPSEIRVIYESILNLLILGVDWIWIAQWTAHWNSEGGYTKAHYLTLFFTAVLNFLLGDIQPPWCK